MESLYRKYRPQTFADVVGQQHVVGTLQRAVMEGRTSHAYLFCGPRGTGKTTMARLLAKSLMCEQGPAQLPDGTCEQCELIAAGEHPDVYELDAASRTGVDNVREEIINRVGYAPVRGRYKVYIIDEVHMLTTAAFNALLKTLEEPPDHVVFVLCTTDPQKIPATILSRVQRFDFRPIGNEDIRERLAYVCRQEGFAFDDAALDLVVRHARGGMRDALSTLEQLSVFGGGSISTEAAQDLLGAVPGAEMGHVVEALAARDVAMLFLQVGEMIESGRDPLQFARDLAAHMRDVYVVAVVGPRPEVLDASADVERLRSEAEAFGSADRVARILTILGDVTRQMATAPNQRLVLEIAFTRMARPQEDLTLESLAERVAELERRPLAPSAAAVPASEVAATVQQPASGRHTPPSPDQVAPSSSQLASSPQPAAQPVQPASQPMYARQPQGGLSQAQPPARTPQPQAAAPRPQAQPPAQPRASAQNQPAQNQPAQNQPPIADSGELQRRWRQVVSELMTRLPARGSLLGNAVALSDDGRVLTVGLPKGSGFALKMLERPDVRAAVEGVVAEQFGQRTLVYREGLAQNPPAYAQQVAPQWSAPAQTQQSAPAPAPSQAVPNRPEFGQPAGPSFAAAPASAPQAPAVPGYPMPWDEPPSDVAPAHDPGPEYVPYEEIGFAGYDEPGVRQPVASTPEPPQSAPAEPPAPTPAPRSAPAVAVAPVSTPVRSQRPADAAPPAASAAAPAQSSAAASQTSSAPAHNIPDDLPPELASILANAFEVFGEDVRVTRG